MWLNSEQLNWKSYLWFIANILNITSGKWFMFRDAMFVFPIIFPEFLFYLFYLKKKFFMLFLFECVCCICWCMLHALFIYEQCLLLWCVHKVFKFLAVVEGWMVCFLNKLVTICWYLPKRYIIFFWGNQKVCSQQFFSDRK